VRADAGPAIWKNWDADAWGRALLRHYFAGHDARPVSRLAVSPEELARAAGASDDEVFAARDAFLKAVRCSPRAFRRHLSSGSLDSHAWDRREPPPFLAYLFLTCFAAASLDADAVDEGVFRERLRQLLTHSVGTSYSLSDLARLWEAFADWLQSRHDAGYPYRTLSLPAPGRMTLIGYSLRLAFPRREDRLRLRDALGLSHTGLSPTVPEAFNAIARARGRFSSDFRHVFDRARAALARGRDVPELQALWSAILEAAALSTRRDGTAIRINYQLLAQEDELGRIDPFVVSAGLPPGPRRGAHFARLDEPFDNFDHVLCAADGTTALIAKLLLMDALEDKAPGLRTSPISRAVGEGVLLFQQVDSAIWELALTRPSEGRVRVLVRTRLSSGFLRLLSGPKRQAHETRFDDWQEILTFDVTELAEPRGPDVSELAAVHCLQRVEVGLQLHLVGGIRVDGGYLGLRELLPEAHCPGAEHTALFRLSEEPGELRSALVAALEQQSERPGVFGWSPGHDDLEGAYVLAGMQEGRVVAPRRVLFHSRGLRHDYESPTNPGRWLVETSTSDVTPAGQGSEVFLETELSRPIPLPTIETVSTEAIRVLTNRSVDDAVEHDRLVEVLAAISVVRKGIAEAELIEILGRIVPQAHGFAVWGIIRGWVEAGYLDCLTRRQWRGRVYFARRPRMILMPNSDLPSIRGVLYGLAPYRLRTTAREVFSHGGATSLPAASLSPSVPAPQAWRFESLEHATTMVAELGGVDTSSVREPRDLVGDIDGAVTDEAPLPPGYEFQRAWNWTAGGFRQPTRNVLADEVRIEYFARTNGPDRYVITAGDHRRTTLSRSWALLHGFRRAGRKAFAPAGSTRFVRPGDDGPQVPLPIARAIGLRSGIVSGPAEAVGVGRCYAYGTEDPSVQRWLLAWLNGARIDGEVARRFAWLCAATSVRSTDAISLPAHLRRRLRDLYSFPDAHSMADRSVPRHLVAHVRRALELAET
jgi:hypothetical protein